MGFGPKYRSPEICIFPVSVVNHAHTKHTDTHKTPQRRSFSRTIAVRVNCIDFGKPQTMATCVDYAPSIL